MSPSRGTHLLMLDEQGDQLFAMTDVIAERARKVGGNTLRSVGHIQRIQRLLDNDAEYVTPQDMLAELAELHPGVRDTFDEASEGAGTDLWALSQGGPEEMLNRTEYTQPALLAAGVAVASGLAG